MTGRATTPDFEANARRAMADANLQQALEKMRSGFVEKRLEAAARLPEFEALRDQSRDIKDHVLANLDHYLERFEAKVIEQGGHVHWCADAAAARDTILGLCRSAAARSVTKSKSMIAEEIDLNTHLEAHGIEPVETDLGEYIVQLAGEPPSHIIAPAVHKTKAQVADLFRRAPRQIRLRQTPRRCPGAARRGAPGAALEIPCRRRRHHGIQLPGRRDRPRRSP